MLLKELLKSQMQNNHYRPVDIARTLGKPRQAVHYVLNRHIDFITLKVLSQYISAVGLKVDLRRMIVKEKPASIS